MDLELSKKSKNAIASKKSREKAKMKEVAFENCLNYLENENQKLKKNIHELEQLKKLMEENISENSNLASLKDSEYFNDNQNNAKVFQESGIDQPVTGSHNITIVDPSLFTVEVSLLHSEDEKQRKKDSDDNAQELENLLKQEFRNNEYRFLELLGKSPE